MNPVDPRASELRDSAIDKQGPAVSIVVTLYNEEENVDSMARNLISTFTGELSDHSFELILVLNGSLDQTPARAGALALEFPQIKLVHIAVNQGYGAGIKAGLQAANGAVIGYTDADEQISATESATVFSEALNGRYDLVKAVRKTRQDGLSRLLITTVYNVLFRVLFNINGTDVNAKPKVFKRSALDKLQLNAQDWFIDAEIMIQCHRLSLSVKEVPINFKARKKGSSNVRLSTILEFLENMWKYRNEKH